MNGILTCTMETSMEKSVLYFGWVMIDYDFSREIQLAHSFILVYLLLSSLTNNPTMTISNHAGNVIPTMHINLRHVSPFIYFSVISGQKLINCLLLLSGYIVLTGASMTLIRIWVTITFGHAVNVTL